MEKNLVVSACMVWQPNFREAYHAHMQMHSVYLSSFILHPNFPIHLWLFYSYKAENRVKPRDPYYTLVGWNILACKDISLKRDQIECMINLWEPVISCIHNATRKQLSTIGNRIWSFVLFIVSLAGDISSPKIMNIYVFIASKHRKDNRRIFAAP